MQTSFGLRNLRNVALALSFLVVLGTGGFMILEGWSFLDSLYMAVITITTVGYSEVHPLSDAGRVFVMGFLVVGLGIFFYGVVQIGESVLRVEFGNWWERRKMEKTIKTMERHYIICGGGRMGRVLSKQLASRRLPFVVIDKDTMKLDRCIKEGWTCLEGDATDDQVLRDANVHLARGLASALPNDADNVYVVLTARLQAPDLQIIARASDERVVAKLERAGANRVVSLYTTAASKMAHFLIHPHVERFLEVFAAEGTELDLAEIEVTATASYSGSPLNKTDFTQRGIIIVAIRRPNGELLLPPPSTSVLNQGDHLIAIGRAEVIEELTQNA